MLKIGEFSKLSRISIRMLRHYDEIGLLAPETTDPFTGYRYYSEAQLITAGRINALKDMGFKLCGAAELLERWEDREALEQRLLDQREEVRLQAEEAARRLRLLDRALERLRKDEPMKYDVSVKTIPERYVAKVTLGKTDLMAVEGLAAKPAAEGTGMLLDVAGDRISGANGSGTVPDHVFMPKAPQLLGRGRLHGTALVDAVQIGHHVIDNLESFDPLFGSGIFEQKSIVQPRPGVDEVLAGGGRKRIHACLRHQSDQIQKQTGLGDFSAFHAVELRIAEACHFAGMTNTKKIPVK